MPLTTDIIQPRVSLSIPMLAEESPSAVAQKSTAGTGRRRRVWCSVRLVEGSPAVRLGGTGKAGSKSRGGDGEGGVRDV